jgi:hypothetical protein
MPQAAATAAEPAADAGGLGERRFSGRGRAEKEGAGPGPEAGAAGGAAAVTAQNLQGAG